MIHGEELAKLYDHIINVNEASDKKDITGKVDEINVKAKPKKKFKKRKTSGESGIEEIRIVRKAVNAFKKKRRLRDLPKGLRKSKKTKFESVVEKVMRMREEEKKFTYQAKTSSRPGTR